MKKNRRVFIMVMWGILIFSVVFLTGSPAALAEEKTASLPMELDGTEWEVEMVYVTENGKKVTSGDTLVFKDKQFISKSFESDKYLPTNYSLVVQEDGTTKFGTMQVKGKETSFWKGLVRDGTIDGSVHTQWTGGATRTTYFTGKLVSGVLNPKAVSEPTPPLPFPPPPADAPDEPVAPAVEEVAQEEDQPADIGVETEKAEVDIQPDEEKKTSGWGLFKKKKD